MNIIAGILRECYLLLNRMSPYLVFGFFLAGVLHIFVNTGTIGRHLGKSTFSSAVKASLAGIPLPLCSCSVIPAAMALRKEGASRGSVLSFLISTPTTGVDSIFATYSLLGPFFTIYRITASFLTGLMAGVTANIFIKEDGPSVKNTSECKLCSSDNDHTHNTAQKVKRVFTYAFGDLLRDSGMALLGGIGAGGIITFFMPEGFIESYLGSGMTAMLVMLVVGIPMYVCATASIPIAAALMLKGMNPGAAFVFLVAGPATNIVTMSVVSKNLGKKALAVYLGSICAGSVLLGLALDRIYIYFKDAGGAVFMIHERILLPEWISVASGIMLLALIALNLITGHRRRGGHGSLS